MPPNAGFEVEPHLITVLSVSLIPKVFENLRNSPLIKKENNIVVTKNALNITTRYTGVVSVSNCGSSEKRFTKVEKILTKK